MPSPYPLKTEAEWEATENARCAFLSLELSPYIFFDVCPSSAFYFFISWNKPKIKLMAYPNGRTSLSCCSSEQIRREAEKQCFFPYPSQDINPMWKYDTIISLTVFLSHFCFILLQMNFSNCDSLIFAFFWFSFSPWFLSASVTLSTQMRLALPIHHISKLTPSYIHILWSLLLQTYISSLLWWHTVICDLSLHPVFLLVTALLLAT